jgi:sensor c-di-GMP phosphodiesterase-like protein
MKKTVVVLLTLLVAVAGIGLPIWLAIEESERQAFKAESIHALGYARDVQMRADETGRQAQAGIDRLAAQHTVKPCAPASIDLMREIDLASSYLQAVGHVKGDRMLCSSIAGATRALALGPVDYVTSKGARVRRNVRFAFAPQDSFIVLEMKGFAAIIHKRLAIDTAKSEPDVSLAVLSLETRCRSSPAATSSRHGWAAWGRSARPCLWKATTWWRWCARPRSALPASPPFR